MIKMEVLSDKCKGCGLCTTACPKKKIVVIQKDARNSKGYFYCRMYRSGSMRKLCYVRFDMSGLRY